MTNVKCGVVILNYNTFDDTKACVESIVRYESSSKREFIVYIVDNKSPDGSGEKLAELYGDNDHNIAVCLADENGGFSKGNNIGIERALSDGCKYVFLLNSDIQLKNNALSIMCRKFDGHDDVAVVGPAVYGPNGEYTQFAKKALSARSLFWSTKPFLKMAKGERSKLREFNFDPQKDYCFYGMVSGCCFGLRSCWLEANGLLDDRVFMYYEEDILAHKLAASGHLSCICHDAQVIHNEGVSTKKASEDSLLFQRFHRWNSSVYVISHYGSDAKWMAWGASAYFRISWLLLAALKPKYRDKAHDFLVSQRHMIKG